MIGFIGALEEEVSGLADKMNNRQRVESGGVFFYFGKIYGKESVVALSGVGKVNAAMTAVLMLSKFPQIKYIINIGVAGGIGNKVNHGDIVVADLCVQHDFTLNTESVPVGNIPGFDFVGFPADPYLISVAEKILTQKDYVYHKGVIATGDEFINSVKKAESLRTQFNAIACDMESASIAHVCYRMKIKFLSVRSCSDKGDDSANCDIDKWLAESARRSIDCACEFIHIIE